MSSDSITLMLDHLKAGDSRAAQQLWERCSQQLVAVARKRFGTAPRRVADEEDIVQCVFFSLCRGAAAGRFPRLDDRGDLWQVLLLLTRDKVAGQIRRNTRQKRGGKNVRGESALQSPQDGGRGFEQVAGDEPSPEFIVALDEQIQQLMGLLNDNHRQVALLRMEGYSNDEIAGQLGVSTRSVERKLSHIRTKWEGNLGPTQLSS